METYSTIFLTFIAFIVFVLRRRFTYWCRHGVKGANYPKLFRYLKPHPLSQMDDMKTFGRIYGGYYLTSKLYCVVNEPDLIRDILVRDAHLFPDRPYLDRGDSPITKSIGYMVGNTDWQRLRALTTPAFTPSKLRSMTGQLVDSADLLVKVMEKFDKKVINLFKYAGVYNQHSRARCFFGINVDLLNDHFHPIVVQGWRASMLRDSTLSQVVIEEAPALARRLKLNFFVSESINFFDQLIQDIVAARKADGTPKGKTAEKDLIQVMLDSHDVTVHDRHARDIAYGLSTEELVGQGILFSGVGVSASVIAHVIHYLCQNSECQQKLCEELANIKDFSYESLNECLYLNAVINETLRLKPPITNITRESNQDYKLSGTDITIPANTAIIFQTYALHHDPGLWPEPELFKPERFLDGTHHPYAFIPFSTGHRSCFVKQFALLEIRVCLVKLLLNYVFTLAPGGEVLEYYKGQDVYAPKKAEFFVNKL